jgi:hypothetical protein
MLSCGSRRHDGSARRERTPLSGHGTRPLARSSGWGPGATAGVRPVTGGVFGAFVFWCARCAAPSRAMAWLALLYGSATKDSLKLDSMSLREGRSRNTLAQAANATARYLRARMQSGMTRRRRENPRRLKVARNRRSLPARDLGSECPRWAQSFPAQHLVRAR